MIQSKFKKIVGLSKTVLFREANRILGYEVPCFEYLYETTIKDAYTTETWEKNGSDSQNYKNQMEIAIKEFLEVAKTDKTIRSKCTAEQLAEIDQGRFPSTLVAHHDRTSGDGATNVVMQIVPREAHKQQPHKGASAMANPRIREKDFQSLYKEQTWFQNLADQVQYTSVKHPAAIPSTVGVSSGLIAGTVARKSGCSYFWSAISAIATGACFGFATYIGQSYLNKNVYVGD